MSELSFKDQAFVQEYVRTRNATRAYMATHPRTKSVNGAGVNAHRKLRSTKVKIAMKAALSLEDLKTELRACVELAKKQKSVKEIRGSVMDYAKLAGLVVDKSEVKAISDEEMDQLRRIVTDMLTPSTS